MALNKIDQKDWDALKRYLLKNRHLTDSHLLIDLMMHTGARTDEIIRLRPCDFKQIDFGKYEVNIFHGSKGSSSRRRAIDSFKSNNLIEGLLIRADVQGLKVNQPLARLFSRGCNASQARRMRAHFARICEILFKDSTRYSLKSIRHTFARTIYKHPRSAEDRLRFASKALGHKSLQSTIHYLDDFNDDKLQSVIDEAF